MRNLTVTRTRSVVGCAVAVQLYVADPSGEVTISGTSCRPLGLLRSGETATFPIGEEATRVFVMTGGSGAKGTFFHDSRAIPAGTEDVELTGKNHYGPFTGNPFRFDGEADAETCAQRKKSGSKSVLITVVAALIGLAVGVGVGLYRVQSNYPEKRPDKTFSTDGMNITLTSGFDKEKTDADSEAMVASYAANNISAFIYCYPYAEALGLKDVSEQKFAELMAQEMGAAYSVETRDDLVCISGVSQEDGEDITVRVVVYKTESAMWMVEFDWFAKYDKRFSPAVQEWAKSVTFSE